MASKMEPVSLAKIPTFVTSRSEAHVLLVTWCRFKAKHAWLPQHSKVAYYWPRLNLFSRWYRSTKHTIVFVFDPMPNLRDKFANRLINNIDMRELEDPFWIYPRLTEEVVRLQDEAVTRIRHLVKETELNRLSPRDSNLPDPDYQILHEVARHAVHVSETLLVACATVESIQNKHSRVTPEHYMRHGISATIENRLAFCLQLLTSLRHRSDSNRIRLGSEIGLAFNLVSQFDSRTSVRIANATQSDSAAMRTIAYVTLIFFPATFASALFSTSFFNFDASTGVWAVSGKFWIYWMVSIPLTALCILSWCYWRTLSRLPISVLHTVKLHVSNKD